MGERGGERVIVDPASRDEEGLEELALKVQEIYDDGSSITATIFTHRHPDHVGDLARISEIYQAPIWASQETLASIAPCETDRVLSEVTRSCLRDRVEVPAGRS